MARRGKRANQLILGAALCLGGMAGTVMWERFRAKPNLCLIVVDSLRADALSGAAGAARIPNIQRLIDDGVRFREVFGHSSDTLPAQASLFTSRLPHETGVVVDGQTFSSNVELLTEELADAGYSTFGTVSVPALWAPDSGSAIETGFEDWEQGTRPFERAAEVLDVVRPKLDEAADSSPFFLYTHFSDPHAPYDANGLVIHEAEVLWTGEVLETVKTSETSFIHHDLRVPPGQHMFDVRSNHAFHIRDFESDAPNRVSVKPRSSDLSEVDGDLAVMINNKTESVQSISISFWIHDAPPISEARLRYRREVEAVDKAIGEIIAQLEDQGVYDETLIVVTAGHGESLGEHGLVGHEFNLYDQTLHVPLVIKLPEESPFLEESRRLAESFFRQVDIAPTILDLLGLNPMRGSSGSSMLKSEPRVLTAEAHDSDSSRTLYAKRDERYKLIYSSNDNRFEMYDLAQDPSELDDVFRTQGHLRADWQQEIKTLLGRTQ